MSSNREVRLRQLAFAALHAAVEAKLPRSLACDPLIVGQVVSATLEELGLQVDEASGEVVGKPAPAEFRPLESNYRNSIHVPARGRRR